MRKKNYHVQLACVREESFENIAPRDHLSDAVEESSK